MPDEVKQRLLPPLRYLEAAPGMESEVLVLHGADVPLAGHAVCLQLEGLVVRDLLLVSCDINTCAVQDF